jgi:hypothetical protein
MTYPVDDPVRTLIAANVFDTLESINGVGSYRTKVRKVEWLGPNVFEIPAYPAILIAPGSVRYTDNVYPLIAGSMTLVCSCAVENAKVDSGLAAAYDLVEDIKLALDVDIQRGGYAIDTHVRSDEPYVPDVTTPLYGVDVTVEVDFRHRRSDPAEAF